MVRWQSKRSLRKTREALADGINLAFNEAVSLREQLVSSRQGALDVQRKMLAEINDLKVLNDELTRINNELMLTLESQLELEQRQAEQIAYLSKQLTLEEKAHTRRTRERDILLAGGTIDVPLEWTATAETVNAALCAKIDELKVALAGVNVPFYDDDVASLVEERNQLVEMRWLLRLECNAADANRSDNRSGRIGTKTIRRILEGS